MKRNSWVKLLGMCVVIMGIYSCKVVPSVMMQTEKDYEFDEPSSDTIADYIISNSDIIDFRLYTNDGTRLVDVIALTSTAGAGANALNIRNGATFLVEKDGLCKLPIIGRVELQGKTIKEAEEYLQEEYSKYYKKPFVVVRVMNRRVTVFPGIGSGVVINIQNENMTLIEALGQVGGLPKTSKAHRIKLVRGDMKDPKVYLFDFSTIDGIKDADFVLQANDIVYVEPQKNTVQEVIADIAPVLSIISSTITLVLVLSRL